MNKTKTIELEYDIAQYFNTRVNLIVPNVFRGLNFLYELDLLVVTQACYAYEVELKVSKSDLLADKNKSIHAHCDKRIKRLYFVVPEELKDLALQVIPENAGLLIRKFATKDKWYPAKYYIKQEKKPKENKLATKLTNKEIEKLKHFCMMRMWKYKKDLINMNQGKAVLKDE